MGRLYREWLDAMRSMRGAPAHVATCVALLALGLASTTAILTLADRLIRRPLPVRDDRTLIVPYGSRGDDKRLSASAIEAEAWRRAPALAGFAVALPGAVTLERDARPARVQAARIEAGYLPLLGVAPVVGRVFDEDEARKGARLALLGFGLWQRDFGSDPGIVGQALEIEGEAWVVVGVLPRGFDLPLGAEIFRPLDLASVPEARRADRVLEPVARLGPGHSLEEARGELAQIGRRLEKERPDTSAGWGVRAITLRRNLLDDPNGAVERSVGLTFWGAGFLLLVACANVAQLLIVRTAGRGVEFGIRLAVGGSRASLARLVGFEALSLTAVATASSVPLSRALSSVLARLEPVSASAFSSRLLDASLEPRILGVGVLIAALAALLAGAYPVAHVARLDAARLLSGAGRASASRGRRYFLEIAVLAQVAVTVVLLSTALTLAESYALLRALDVGFRPDGVSYYELSLSPRDYGELDRRSAFAEALVEGVRALPGVTAAAFTTNVPLAPLNWVARYGCEGRVPVPGELLMTADRLVGPRYLETLGLRLRGGRTITDRDLASTQPVAVINESLARECWPAQDPIGKRVLRMSRSGTRALQVVGVVADARELRVSFRTPHAAWYLPYRQHDFLRDVDLVVRGDAAPEAVRAVVRRLDPHQPLDGPRRLADLLEGVTGSDRLAALVTVYFAVAGLLLASVGIHGSMRRFVGEQRRAIGTRLAFGAEPNHIVASLLRRGLRLSGLGVALALPGALALQRTAAGFVYGAVLATPVRLASIALFVLALTTAACAAPALRASRIDPARLLRQ
jgi:putative ABC transport system permease protein